MSEKLQKVLARFGVGSRRDMEEYIKNGRVSVNGKLATLGDRVEEDAVIRVDGQIVKTATAEKPVCRVLIYNKPEGQMCTSSDPQGRPTVFDRLPSVHNGRWLYIGRLDINTSGLLLFTTDGELANGLMHPRNEVERVYAVRVFGEVTAEHLEKLQTGVELEDGVAHFDKVIFAGGEGINRWYNVVLKEGRKREVRRLWEALGLQVSRLKRTSYAGIELGKLPQGGWEELPLKDVNALRALAGLRPETRSVVNEAADKDRGGDNVRREFLKRRQVSHAIERFEPRTGFGRGRKKDFEAKPRAGADRTNFAPTASFMDEERSFAAENAGERRFSRNEGRSQGRSFAARNRNGEENKFTRGARLASDRQERSGRDFFKAASFEEKRSSGRKFGDRKFEGRFEGRSFGDRKFEGRSEGRSFGDRKFEGRSEGRSFGERKFEGRSEGRSFEGRRGRGSFGRSEGRNGSEYGRKSFDGGREQREGRDVGTRRHEGFNRNGEARGARSFGNRGHGGRSFKRGNNE